MEEREFKLDRFDEDDTKGIHVVVTNNNKQVAVISSSFLKEDNEVLYFKYLISEYGYEEFEEQILELYKQFLTSLGLELYVHKDGICHEVNSIPMYKLTANLPTLLNPDKDYFEALKGIRDSEIIVFKTNKGNDFIKRYLSEDDIIYLDKLDKQEQILKSNQKNNILNKSIQLLNIVKKYKIDYMSFNTVILLSSFLEVFFVEEDDTEFWYQILNCYNMDKLYTLLYNRGVRTLLRYSRDNLNKDISDKLPEDSSVYDNGTLILNYIKG